MWNILAVDHMVGNIWAVYHMMPKSSICATCGSLPLSIAKWTPFSTKRNLLMKLRTVAE